MMTERHQLDKRSKLERTTKQKVPTLIPISSGVLVRAYRMFRDIASRFLFLNITTKP